MTSAKKLTYTIKAEYAGKGDMKQLSDDLKALNKVDVLQGVEKSFNQANKDFVEAKKKVRELRDAMKEPGGEAFASSYAKARKEVKQLQTALQQQKQKLDQTRTSLKQQGVDVAAITSKYADMQAATEKHARAIAARQKLGVRSWREIKNEIAGLERAYKDMEASGEHSMAELAQAKEKLIRKTDKLNEEMGKTNVVARKSATNFRNMEGSLGRVTTNLTAFVGGFLGFAAVLSAGYGVSRMATDVTENIKQLEIFARTAGTSVSEFSALAYAVKTVGMEQDKLADIMKEVKVKVGDFMETGGGEFADFFVNIADQAGITAEELIKMSGPDALIAIKKAMDDVNISAENQIFYLDALANDAERLIPLLENEGKAFKELAQHAKDSGIALSDLDFAELIALQKTLKDFRDNLAIIRREIVVALAPGIQQLAEYFKQNKEQIREFAVDVANFVTGATDKILRFMSTLEAFRDFTRGSISLSQYFDLGPNQQRAYGAIRTEMQMIKNLEDDIAAARKSLARKERFSLFFDSADMADEKNDLATMQEYVEHLRQRIAEKIEKMGAGFKTFSEKGKEAFNKTDAAAEISANKQTRVTGAALENMRQQYKQFAADVSNLTLDFAAEEARIQIEMVGDEKGRQIILNQVAEIKRLAAEAGSAGGEGWNQQIELLNRAKGLIMSMGTDAKAVSKEDVDMARQKLELARQEMNFHNVSPKRSAYRQALEDYQQLVQAQKQGPSEAEKQERIREKLERVKEINKEILAVKKEQADALNKESGGKLAEELPEVAKQLGHVKGQTEDLTAQSKLMDIAWKEAFAEMLKNGKATIAQLDGRIIKLTRDRHMKIYITEVTKKSGGGPIGSARIAAMAAGGQYRSAVAGFHFRGYGGGDQPKNLVMAEDGEVMIRKEMVKAAGLRAALAWNAGRFDIVLRELMQRFDTGIIKKRMGGVISSLNQPVLPAMPQMMAAGGAVAASEPVPVLGHYTHDFRFPGSQEPVRMMSDRENLQRMLREAERMHRRRS